MKTIAERNTSLLRFYGQTARIVGYVLLCGGIVWALIFGLSTLAVVGAAGDLQWPGLARNAGYAVSTFALNFLVPGCLAFLIAEFIRYVLDAKGGPGLVLRHGKTVLYACGAILAGQALLSLAGWETVDAKNADEAGLLFVGPVLIPLLAKALACVALGHLLGRMLPIIDESKTLV
jgi:hypothetical protein